MTKLALAAVLSAGALAAGCTMKDEKAPPLTGPSELSTAIVLTAVPDAIQQDGASQSLITVTVRDASGQPIRNAPLRAAIAVGGTFVDFGSLSAKNLVTGSDGRATLVYTAPPSVAGVQNVDQGTVVDIVITPQGTNYQNVNGRTVTIRLLPVGVVLGPNTRPVPDFTIAPTNATVNVKIVFDASSSYDPDGEIVRYEWKFSDGDSGLGVTVTHGFTAAGSYTATLTVTDDRGASASTTKNFTVGAPVLTAAFTSSPSDPTPGQSVNFNASTSTVEGGHRIVRYTWDFGDGSAGATTTSPTVSHTYLTENSFVVTLTITDDLGRTATTTGTVSVKLPGPATIRKVP